MQIDEERESKMQTEEEVREQLWLIASAYLFTGAPQRLAQFYALLWVLGINDLHLREFNREARFGRLIMNEKPDNYYYFFLGKPRRKKWKGKKMIKNKPLGICCGCGRAIQYEEDCVWVCPYELSKENPYYIEPPEGILKSEKEMEESGNYSICPSLWGEYCEAEHAPLCEDCYAKGDY